MERIPCRWVQHQQVDTHAYWADAKVFRRGRGFWYANCISARRAVGRGVFNGDHRPSNGVHGSCIPQLRRQRIKGTLVRIRTTDLAWIHRCCREGSCSACGEFGRMDDTAPVPPQVSVAACEGCGELLCDVACTRRTKCPHIEHTVDEALANAEALCGLGCQCECCRARLPPACDICDSSPCVCNAYSKWQAMYGGSSDPRSSDGSWSDYRSKCSSMRRNVTIWRQTLAFQAHVKSAAILYELECAICVSR